MRAFLIAVVFVLALPGAVLAHVSISPGLLETGRETTLRIELPDLRSGLQPSALDVSGPGVQMVESSHAGQLGKESRWRVRVDIETAPGPLPLVLRARYADRRTVTVRQTVTVLPARAAAPSSRPVLAAGVGVLALLAVVAATFLVHRARGRP